MAKPENIIYVDFKQEKRERPSLYFKPPDPKGCQHQTMYIDQDLWRVVCEDCGEVLDPIRVLDQIAQDEVFLYQRKIDVEQLYNEIMKLKKEEKRLKNKIKRQKAYLEK